ncbi:hypothetical protein A1QC_11430 [Vibrio rumoiensis 1S-45]|uniref:Uncharacterized protein n=1 Tax=Vibrio rumoiensis 1S-45 TaxID=1188252 RepID=A0A1E5DZT9_9VIBR|nr:hypothetical protein A1QC_11430 [Vibrio rumoiensis 1S-45]
MNTAFCFYMATVINWLTLLSIAVSAIETLVNFENQHNANDNLGKHSLLPNKNTLLSRSNSL